jgi:hypothetical protein
MIQQHWKHLDKPEFGLVNQVSALVHSIDLADFRRLPNLHRGSNILIGSDYGGDHRASDYEVLSFILADIEQSKRWDLERRQVRSSLLKDGRRFAFKNLRDRNLSRALPRFICAADHISGLLVGILTHKNIGSLFKLTGRIMASDPEISGFPGWKPVIMERLLRVVHFISLFLAGLSRFSQDVLWITDEDAIAPNESKHLELVTIFGRVCSHYLAHNLGHIRVGTTASDTGSRDVEDFVALPDLAAEALAEVVTLYARTQTSIIAGVSAPIPAGCTQKTLQLMNWLSNSSTRLKKLFFAIDPIHNSTALTVRLLNFHSSKTESIKALAQ